MKKVLLAGVALTLLSSAASAADLPRRAPPPVFTPIPVFSWSGVYIGTHTSYAFSDNQRITTTGNDVFSQAILAAGIIPATVSSEQDRFAKFGGTFGINYQLTPGSGFVLGAAISADWTDMHKNTFVLGTPLPLVGVPLGSVFTQSLDWLATANGRVGYAFDRFMIYATGGAAIGKVRYGASAFLPTVFGPILVAGGGDGENAVGYNYGGGIEYAIPRDSILGKFDLLELLGIKLGGSSTLKAEYIRYDLGSRNVLVSDALGFGISSTSRFHTEGSIVRAGFNYKFP